MAIPFVRPTQTSLFLGLPADTLRYIATFHDELPKDFYDAPVSSIDYCFMIPLEKAHLLAERFYTQAKLCRVSKGLDNAFKSTKDDLGKKIIELLDNAKKNDIACSVSLGWYRCALKIYFFYKPTALKNDNILQCAICTDSDRRPPSLHFISFLLKLSKEHHLKLLEQKSENTDLSLVSVCNERFKSPLLVKPLIRKFLEDDPQAAVTVNALIPTSPWNNVTLIYILLKTSLSISAQKEQAKDIEENIKLLQSYGANINLQNSNGATALHLALGSPGLEILLKCGADQSIQNKHKLTPSQLCLELMLEHGPESAVYPYYADSLAILLKHQSRFRRLCYAIACTWPLRILIHIAFVIIQWFRGNKG